jgi:hypothetical protein
MVKRIQFHLVDSCAVQVPGAFPQNENGRCRGSHADGIQENSKTQDLIEGLCKKSTITQDGCKYSKAHC